MSKSGEEETLRECDENIQLCYRIVKNNKEDFFGHHYRMMDRSLDRRIELSNREQVVYKD
jgi:hypothetical protein